MFKRLAFEKHPSFGAEICEDIFIWLEKEADTRELTQYEKALYNRLKRFEVNSREAYENFYNVLAGKTE